MSPVSINHGMEYDNELKREVKVAFSVRDIDDAIKKIQEANTVPAK